jgi:hypothetical protein
LKIKLFIIKKEYGINTTTNKRFEKNVFGFECLEYGR